MVTAVIAALDLGVILIVPIPELGFVVKHAAVSSDY